MGQKTLLFAVGLAVGASWPFVLSFVSGPPEGTRIAGLNIPAANGLPGLARDRAAGSAFADPLLSRYDPAFALDSIVPAVVRVITDSTAGSGVVIDPEGVVLTSGHIVAGAENVRVVFDDGAPVRGTVVRLDAAADLALLRLPAGKYASAELGAEEDIVLGAPVYSVGYPMEMEGPPTVTKGVVSRYFKAPGDLKLLQTDAAINLGNSGGPIVSESGRIVGIVDSIGGDDPFSLRQGISFAISVATVRERLID